MSEGHTREKLAADFRALGVCEGDIVFVHSSFKSLGPVDGGAETVIRALEDALGPDGLLMMPSFNLVEDRQGTWDVDESPSTVGWITEYFRRMPGTVRSDHYSHAVAARGKGADEIIADHLLREGPDAPWDRGRWGKTFGSRSPMLKAYERGGKLLMLGVDYHSSTYVHVIEVLYRDFLKQTDPDAEYVWLKREVLGEHWDEVGEMNRGKVGDADCRLFDIRAYVDTLLGWVKEDVRRWGKFWD